MISKLAFNSFAAALLGIPGTIAMPLHTPTTADDCKLCHTVVLDPGPGETYGHFFSGDAFVMVGHRAPASTAGNIFRDAAMKPRILTPYAFKCYGDDHNGLTGCHTTGDVTNACSYYHSLCEDQGLIAMTIAVANRGDWNAVRSFVKGNPKLRINAIRGSIQVMDCNGIQFVANIPVPNRAPVSTH